MILMKPKYEILTNISSGGIDELKLIERVGRVCYKSEDRITEDGESAKKFINMIIKSGHHSVIEHSILSVLFTVDRGVTHEMVRHRIASFAQESSRYCNYSIDKFGNNINLVIPTEFILNKDNNYDIQFEEKEYNEDDLEEILYSFSPDIRRYIEYKKVHEGLSRINIDNVKDIIQESFKNFFSKFGYNRDQQEKMNKIDFAVNQYIWAYTNLRAEASYMKMTNNGAKPDLARSILNNSTKANITITANFREWRNIFKLRCDPHAHLDIRYVMVNLLNEVHDRIPVIFDDIYDECSQYSDFDLIIKKYNS